MSDLAPGPAALIQAHRPSTKVRDEQRAAQSRQIPHEGAQLHHMGARFYDPTIGRWLSEDPVQDKYFEPTTLNFYAYAFNNPTILIDPDGQAPEQGILSRVIRSKSPHDLLLDKMFRNTPRAALSVAVGVPISRIRNPYVRAIAVFLAG